MVQPSPRARKPTWLTTRTVQLGLGVVITCCVAWQLLGRTPPLKGRRAQVPMPQPPPCAGTCVLTNLDDLQPMSPHMYGLALSPEDLAMEAFLLGELIYDHNFAAFTWFKQHPTSTQLPQPLGAAAAAARQRGMQQGQAGADGAAAGGAAALAAALGMEPTLDQLEQLPAVGHSLQGATPRERESWQVSSNTRVQLLQNLGDPHAVRLQVGAAQGEVVNSGTSLNGFAVVAGKPYLLRVRWRSMKGDIGSLSVSLVHGVHTHTGSSKVKPPNVLATVKHKGLVAESWELLSDTLTPNATSREARLVVAFKGPGSVDLDWVSLAPAHMAAEGVVSPSQFDPSALAHLRDLAPRFMRFTSPHMLHVSPGEDAADLDGTRQPSWQSGLSSTQSRPGYEHPAAPNLWVAGGLGIHELMWLASELQAEPVWEVPIPSSSSYQEGGAAGGGATGSRAAAGAAGAGGGEDARGIEMESAVVLLGRALEVLQFLHGPVEHRWGKVRASLGRPNPWKLTYMALTSTDCLNIDYGLWYRTFSEALEAHHPHMQLLSSCSWEAAVEHATWDVALGARLDPGQLFTQVPGALDWYEGPRLSVPNLGSLSPTSNVIAAVSEAGVMAALERNCGKVRMVSHGSLLGLSGGPRDAGPSHLLTVDWQGSAARTPSYHVQQLFRKHMGSQCARTSLLVEGVDLRSRTDPRAFWDGYDDDLEEQALIERYEAMADDDEWMEEALEAEDREIEAWEREREQREREHNENHALVGAVSGSNTADSRGAAGSSSGGGGSTTQQHATAGGGGSGSTTTQHATAGGGSGGSTTTQHVGGITVQEHHAGATTAQEHHAGATTAQEHHAGATTAQEHGGGAGKGRGRRLQAAAVRQRGRQQRLKSGGEGPVSSGGGGGGNSSRHAIGTSSSRHASSSSSYASDSQLLQQVASGTKPGQQVASGKLAKKAASSSQTRKQVARNSQPKKLVAASKSQTRQQLAASSQPKRHLAASSIQRPGQVAASISQPHEQVAAGGSQPRQQVLQLLRAWAGDLLAQAQQLLVAAGPWQGRQRADGADRSGDADAEAADQASGNEAGTETAADQSDGGKTDAVHQRHRRRLQEAAGASRGGSAGAAGGATATVPLGLADLDAARVTAAKQLEASASCVSGEAGEAIRCRRVAVKVVNWGATQQDVTVQLWSARRRLPLAATPGTGAGAGRTLMGGAAGTGAGAGTGTGRTVTGGGAGSGAAEGIGGARTLKGNEGGTEDRQTSVSVAEGDGVLLSGRRLLGRLGRLVAGRKGAAPRTGTLLQMSASDPLMDTNELTAEGAVNKVEPHSRTIQVTEQTRLSLPPYSLSVLVVDLDTAAAPGTKPPRNK